MALTVSQLLDACERVYDSPTIAVGPDGVDACSITPFPQTGDVLLAFRGTLVPEPGPGLLLHLERAWLDWENDLHDEPEAAPELFPGRVHRGFLASMRRLWPVLRDRPLKNLTITGHSKGGSLAILAGWLLRSLQPSVQVFAAAKVGDSAFAAAYQLAGPPTVLYENPHDVVPLLPPVGFDKVGRVVNPPRGWRHPFGVVRNHCLKTGYAWARDLDEPPGPAASMRVAA